MKKIGLIFSFVLFTQVVGAAFASADTLTTADTTSTSNTVQVQSATIQPDPPSPSY